MKLYKEIRIYKNITIEQGMENLTPAERMYKNHLKNVSKYQKNNPEKMRLKNQRRKERLMENPEAYTIFREKAIERSRAFRQRQKLKK